MARSGGQRRDVEMDLTKREKEHTLAVSSINAEIRIVERAIEEADRKQALALTKLEELQRLELASRAHEDQLKTMRGLQDVEIDAEERRLNLNIKGGDADHRRQIESKRLEQEANLEKIKALRDASPETILAIQAGFSPAVANVMVEQAKAKSVNSAEQMNLMREMIQQAQNAQVQSEAQARHMFDAGMQGTVGVAQGVGMGVGAGANAAGGGDGRLGGGADRDTTECPACHRTIPVTDRHCRYCGRAMRQ